MASTMAGESQRRVRGPAATAVRQMVGSRGTLVTCVGSGKCLELCCRAGMMQTVSRCLSHVTAEREF